MLNKMKASGDGRIHRSVARFERFLLTPLSFAVPILAVAYFFQRAWLIGGFLLFVWFCVAYIGQSLHKNKSYAELRRGGLTREENIKPEMEISLEEAHELARSLYYFSVLFAVTTGVLLFHHGCRWFVAVPIGLFFLVVMMILGVLFAIPKRMNPPLPTSDEEWHLQREPVMAEQNARIDSMNQHPLNIAGLTLLRRAGEGPFQLGALQQMHILSLAQIALPEDSEGKEDMAPWSQFAVLTSGVTQMEAALRQLEDAGVESDDLLAREPADAARIILDELGIFS